MGRIVGPKANRRQKGVDSLIVRDLIVLSKERAIASAFLLAGDEDLREGVATAQEQGLQVTLLGIPPKWDPANQAPSLIREADAHIVLTAEFWAPFFRKVAAPAPLLPKQPAATGAREIGLAFATEWMKKADPEDVQKLLERAPRIPMELDVTLIVEAEQTLGSLRDRDPEKRELRAGFWSVIRAAQES
jgi:hypothetical protein